MLATFIRQVSSHGKTPTGAFGDYLSREESKVALARTKERIDENFEDGLVASYEAQSPDNPSGAVAERDMNADGDKITTTTTVTATPPIATTTTIDATMTAGAAEETVLDGILWVRFRFLSASSSSFLTKPAPFVCSFQGERRMPPPSWIECFYCSFYCSQNRQKRKADEKKK